MLNKKFAFLGVVFVYFLNACTDPVEPNRNGVDPDLSGQVTEYSEGSVFENISGFPIAAKGQTVDFDSLTNSYILSGWPDEYLSYGRTSGVSFLTTDSWEQLASSQKIKISVRARSQSDLDAPFLVAYSTNENGNSGWQRFVATRSSQKFEFFTDVGVMIEGKGDYIGIIPDADKIGSKLLVENIEMTIIADP